MRAARRCRRRSWRRSPGKPGAVDASNALSASRAWRLASGQRQHLGDLRTSCAPPMAGSPRGIADVRRSRGPRVLSLARGAVTSTAPPLASTLAGESRRGAPSSGDRVRRARRRTARCRRPPQPASVAAIHLDPVRRESAPQARVVGATPTDVGSTPAVQLHPPAGHPPPHEGVEDAHHVFADRVFEVVGPTSPDLVELD